MYGNGNVSGAVYNFMVVVCVSRVLSAAVLRGSRRSRRERVTHSVPRAGSIAVPVAGQSGAGWPNSAASDQATVARAVQDGQMLLRNQPPGSALCSPSSSKL